MALAPHKKKVVKRKKAVAVKPRVAKPKPVPPPPPEPVWKELDPRALKVAFETIGEVERGSYCASWVCFCADGRTDYQTNNPCHAHLLSTGEREILLIPHKGYSLRECDREFIKWMCTEGPGSAFVINRDNPKQLCDEGVLWAYAYATKDQTYWFAKTLRCVFEESYRAANWYKFVKLGVHPMTALIAACVVNSAGVFSNTYTHGLTFYGPASIADLRKALTTKWEATKKVPPGKAGASFDLFYRGCKSNVYYTIPYSSTTIFEIGKSRQEKVADGWGGFTYTKIPASDEEDAKLLIKLTEEALKDG